MKLNINKILIIEKIALFCFFEQRDLISVKLKTNILFWTIIFLLLLPVLFFPLSPDSSIYLESGKIIANGGKLYVDTIDLKQPLIYYLFALIYNLFGYSEISVRLFDLIWQFATIISLFILVNKAKGKVTAFIASMIYAVSYTALGYSQCLQCESFAALPILWLIYFRTYHQEKFHHLLLTGILTGLIAGFKFTLLLVFLAITIDIIIKKPAKLNKILSVIILFLGCIICFAITMSPIFDSMIFKGYLNVLKYLTYYSTIQSFGVDSIKLLIKNTGAFFGDRYSLPLTISFLAGLYSFIKHLQNQDSGESSKMMNLSFLMLFFLFLSVVWEGKYWDYHMTRMYIPLIILTSIGLEIVITKIREFYKSGGIYLKIIIVLLCMCAILFSPFSRWLNISRTAFFYFTNIDKYDAQFSEIISYKTVPLRKQHKLIAETINKNPGKKEMVLVISTGSNAINFFLNTDRVSAFRNSQFIFNPVNIHDWKIRFRKELNSATWIIVQTDDSREQVIGEDLSSWELFKRDSNYALYLYKNFYLFKQIGNFLIFRRYEK